MIELRVFVGRVRGAYTAIMCLAPLMALGACSPATVLNNLADTRDVTVHKSIAYAPGPRHLLDIYAPADANPAITPVLVFIYGGAWRSGDRSLYRFLGASLASHGVMVVVPDYRLYPEVRFPDFVYDAAAAVAWTRTHAAAFGGDVDHLFLMGHSAGGHIAALLALDSEYLKSVGLSPRVLSGVIGISGPYDFLPLEDPVNKAIFGAESAWPHSQPVNFVTAQAPPMLLATGAHDNTVWPRNTYHLAERLRAAGDTVDVRVYDGVGHLTIIGAFAPQLTLLAPVRRDVLGFIHSHAGAQPKSVQFIPAAVMP